MSAPSLAAERSIIGAMITFPESIATASKLLACADFDDPKLGIIFRRLLAIDAAGHAVTLPTLADELMRHGELARIGGPLLLAELADEEATAATLHAHARIVREHALRRRIRALHRRAADGDARDGDSAELECMERALADAAGAPEPTESQRAAGAPILVRMSDVEPEEVSWLWHPFIPVGKLTLLEGDPGVGKTHLALALAAAVSRGWPLPGEDGVPSGARAPASSLYLTAEDGLADTLRPRLDAAQADASRVYVLDGMRDKDGEREGVTLQDLDTLRDALEEVRPALLVVDPLQGFLGPLDMHRANEVRPVLAGLGRLAEEFSCSVVCIRHLRKSACDRAVHRGLGSVDFAAAARSILLVGRDPEDDARRVMAQSKSSLAAEGQSLAFTLGDGFHWAGTSELTPDDLLAAPKSDRTGAVDAAAEWLRGELAEGAAAASVLTVRARAAGHSERTLKRAKAALGVEAEKSGFRGGWLWALPREGGQVCQVEEVGPLRAKRSEKPLEPKPDDDVGPLGQPEFRL